MSVCIRMHAWMHAWMDGSYVMLCYVMLCMICMYMYKRRYRLLISQLIGVKSMDIAIYKPNCTPKWQLWLMNL